MDGAYQDKVLHCRECDSDFVWTAGEQAFYASKGLVNQPGRCPSCRATARAARESGGPSANGHARVMYPAVCDRCGVQAQVPFLPRTDRPVYCSSCYDSVRAERVSSYSTA